MLLPKEIDSLIMKATAGDKEAFHKLYLELRKPVFLFALTLCRHYELAEDITQDTFVALWNSARSYLPNGCGKTWIFAIAKNITRTELRKRKSLSLEEVLSNAGHNTSSGEDPESIVADRLFVKGLLHTLSERERDVVILHVLVGLKHREIAEFLNAPPGTISWRYQSAVKKLNKHCLDERGKTP